MLIDWFTVIAQILNFLILVVLLKHFLYGRIIDAMDAREKQIAERFEEAQSKREEAKQEAKSYKEKSQELEARKDTLIQDAKEEAENQKKELTKKARKEADRLKKQWQDAVKQEKETFLKELHERVNRHVYRVVRRALKDLADADLETQIVESFIQRLKKLDEDKRKTIRKRTDSEDDSAVVRSPFEVASADRRKLTRAIHEFIHPDLGVDYETRSDMVLGIELKYRGHKVAWSVEEYLNDMESHIREFMEQEEETGDTHEKDTGETDQKADQ